MGRSPAWPAGLAVAAIVVATAALILWNYDRIERREAARIESVAESHARAITAWLRHREAEMQFIATSARLAEQYASWRVHGHRGDLESLMARLVAYREANEYFSALVLGERAEIVARESPGAPASPEMKAAVLRAYASGRVQRTEIYSGERPDPGRIMDLVAPLPTEGPTPRGAVVLRIDTEQFLFPLLHAGHANENGYRSTLVRREGAEVSVLSDKPGGGSAAPIPRVAFERVRAISNSARSSPPGPAVETTDYRGAHVLAVGRLVEGSDWVVVTKEEYARIAAEGRRNAAWIAMGGLAAIATALAIGANHRSQLALREANLRRADQLERLRALQLLDGIADSSADPIFAKDREGRYLLFNREACRITGKSGDQVVGRGDGVLFPPAQAQRIREENARVLAEAKPVTFEQSLTTVDGDRVFLITLGALRDEHGVVTGTCGVAHDITRRKRDELALRDSAHRLKAIQDSIRSQLAVLDREGNIVEVNAAWEEFSRRNSAGACTPSPNAGVGANYLEICRAATGESSEFSAEAGEGIRRVLEGEVDFFEGEYPCRAPGPRRWFTLRVSPLIRGGGGAVVVHTEITARKLAEEELAEREALLRLFVEHAPAAIAMFDQEMRYVCVSRRWMQDYRLGDRNILGLSHYDVFPETPEHWRRTHRRCLAGTVESCDEEPFRRADGRVDWVRREIRPWRHADGTVGGILIFSEDVTERMKRSRELRGLSLAVEQSFSSVMITDASGTIDYVNAAFCHVSGYERDEVLGRNPRFLQSGKTPPATFEAMWATLAGGAPWRGELVNRRKDGAEYVERLQVSPIRQADGRITNFVGISEDVTEQRRTAAELERHRDHLEELVALRTQSLERALQNLETFSYTVSHDLRAPLRAISGFATALAESESAGLSEDGRRMLSRVVAGARRMDELILAILEYSRSERLERKDAAVDTAALVERIAREMMASYPRATFTAGELPEVRADPTMTEEVFSNLMGNAFKFSSKRADARIEVGATTVDGVPEFFVKDNGTGFDPEHGAKLFRLFRRMPGAEGFPGTGLGLAIVKRLVERHGGRIRAESVPGQVTVFRFTLAPDRGPPSRGQA